LHGFPDSKTNGATISGDWLHVLYHDAREPIRGVLIAERRPLLIEVPLGTPYFLHRLVRHLCRRLTPPVSP
jgi:hypothetical protein